jgi:hypothetical protein
VLALVGREVRVTNPHKSFFGPFRGDAGIRKIDLVRYYVSVAEAALRNVRGRPVARGIRLAAKHGCDLLGRDHLELVERTGLRGLVPPPATELSGMAKARTLHVIVPDLHDQLGTQWLPRQILALTPTAQAARHALRGRTDRTASIGKTGGETGRFMHQLWHSLPGHSPTFTLASVLQNQSSPTKTS